MNIIKKNLIINAGEDTSLGGDQEWLRAGGYKDIAEYGCGVVAACNLLICYKGLTHEDRDNTKDGFIELVKYLYKNYINIPDIPFIKGLTGFGLTRGLNRYFRDNKIPLRTKWGKSYKTLPLISKTLKAGLPVILGIGPEITLISFLKKLKSFFVLKEALSFTDDSGGVCITDILTGEKKQVCAHYVTVYEIIEEASDTTLLISSWGRGYKLSYNEFIQYQKRTVPGFLLSNIVKLKML